MPENVTKIARLEDIMKVQAQVFALKSELEQGKIYTCTICPESKKRSLDANSYFWVLCDKLAEKLNAPREEIYRNYIKQYGVFEILPVLNEKVEELKKRWARLGLGWFCEEVGESKLKGCTNIHKFYGSSVYESVEMSRIIEAIVQDCKEQGIETKTPVEIAELLSLWESRGAK